MNFIKFSFGFIILSFILFSCKDYEYKPIDTWKQLNNFPGTARASAVSFSYGNKAYMALGRTDIKSGFLKDLWEYDVEKDSWTRKTDFPGSARIKAIAGVVGNKAYIGLGCVAAYDGNQFSDLWEYDINNDTWKQMASFPGEGKTDLICEVVDGCIYTFSGFGITGYNQDTYKFDPSTNEWTFIKNVCPFLKTNTAGFKSGFKVYIGSGFQGGNLKDFYSYDTQNDTWTRLADLPKGRMLSKGLEINGRGFIMLGRYWNGPLDGGKLLSDVLEYNIATDKWIKCGNFLGGGRQNMIVFSIGNKGYLVGGEDDNERKSDVWVFEP